MTAVLRRGRAAFRHLVGCKRLDCPVCGPAVAEREAADIGLAVAAHYANGGRVALVTLTLRHVRSQPLSGLLGALSGAWRASRENKRPKGLWKLHTAGFIRKLEVTHGANGWHPHLHLLVFLRPGVTEAQASGLFGSVFDAWAGRLVREGLAAPSRRRGIDYEILDVEAAAEAAGSYVAKDAGRELASAGTKRGRREGNRTTYGLLMAGVAGDELAGWLYREYEDAMRGRARVEWSKGLKDRLLDPELRASSEDLSGREVAVLPWDTFEALKRRREGLPRFLDWLEGHPSDADAFLYAFGRCVALGIPPPSPPERLRAAVARLRPASPAVRVRLF